MKSSQMPFMAYCCMGWQRPSQWLKGPTTLTRRALGAQTAKVTPGTPSTTRGCAPSRS